MDQKQMNDFVWFTWVSRNKFLNKINPNSSQLNKLESNLNNSRFSVTKYIWHKLILFYKTTKSIQLKWLLAYTGGKKHRNTWFKWKKFLTSNRHNLTIFEGTWEFCFHLKAWTHQKLMFFFKRQCFILNRFLL